MFRRLMFGIGFGELTVVLIVVLLAVGPDKLPELMRTVGKGLRQFRRAATDLRAATGIDEIMREENLKELDELRKLKGQRVGDYLQKELKKPAQFVRDEIQKPLDEVLEEARGSTVAAKNEAKRAGGSLGVEQLAAEQPPEGVDVAHARARLAAPEPKA